jgi:hypothetical protein
MLDWIRTDTAPIAPQKCVATNDYHGPFVDTHMELPGYGRVYLSLNAIEWGMRAFGITKGKRHTQLLAADKKLDELKQEADDAVSRADALDSALKHSQGELATTTERLERAYGRIAQLETRLADEAKANMDLVTGART